MCYVGVIDVYYNDNDNDEDDDVVASKLGCASDPSLPPPTPIDGTSPPNRPPNQPTPTIPPPWWSQNIVGPQRPGHYRPGGGWGSNTLSSLGLLWCESIFVIRWLLREGKTLGDNSRALHFHAEVMPTGVRMISGRWSPLPRSPLPTVERTDPPARRFRRSHIVPSSAAVVVVFFVFIVVLDQDLPGFNPFLPILWLRRLLSRNSSGKVVQYWCIRLNTDNNPSCYPLRQFKKIFSVMRSPLYKQ